MKAGMEATALLGQRSGVGHYVARLREDLLRLPDSDWELVSYTPRGRGALRRAPAPLAGRAAPARWRRWLWVQLRLAAQARRDGCEILHCPNGMGPVAAAPPLVVTVHDLSLFRYPQLHPRGRTLLTRRLLPRLARRAAAVIADSEFTRREILAVLRVAPEKVRTIHCAAGEHFRPITDGAGLTAVRQRWRLPERYVLFVGTLEPRKNLARLLRAFAAARRAGSVHQLILAGAAGWRMRGFARDIDRLGLSGSVRHLGYVPDVDLPALYAHADLFAYPSLYEGFGLPVLEAMACGTPVLSSNTSALAEVCGDAAQLVDPEDGDALAAALSSLLSDGDRRAELRGRGLERAREFSWRRAAAQTLSLYREVASGGKAQHA